jgi:hypothetical protein
MLKYKILIELFVLNCVFICFMYGDTIQAEVTVLWYNETSRHNTNTSAWMMAKLIHMNSKFSTDNFISISYFNTDFKPLFKT